MDMTRPCILVLGGSFDPVHCGHVHLAKTLMERMRATHLHLVPAGLPWQKPTLIAPTEARLAMLECAFADLGWPYCLDTQEIERARGGQASYTLDTLRTIRAHYGPSVSIVFALGADQLQNLHTWHCWDQLLTFAHLCAASRPGFSLEHARPAVAEYWRVHARPIDTLANTPSGHTALLDDLHIDLASSTIRAQLATRHLSATALPAKVLDYIQLHHLYF
jgi:nicotinate-nucleotide adenylyltransferase